MMRLPVVPSLLISVVVFALVAVGYMATGKDALSPHWPVYGMWGAAIAYLFPRYQAFSAMEWCTIYAVMGSMLVIMAFTAVGVSLRFHGIPDWLVRVLMAGAGIFVLLHPYLFKERLERKKEEWDQAALYWKRKRLERRKSAS